MRFVSTVLVVIVSLVSGGFAEAFYLTATYGGDLFGTARFAIRDIFFCAIFSGVWLACWALLMTRTTTSAAWILAALALWNGALWFWYSSLWRDYLAVLAGFGVCVSCALVAALWFRAAMRFARQ